LRRDRSPGLGTDGTARALHRRRASVHGLAPGARAHRPSGRSLSGDAPDGGADAEARDRLTPEEGLHESTEIAIQHLAGGRRLILRPMVLDKLIRLQDIASDLMAEGGLELRTSLDLVLLSLPQLGSQDLQGVDLVLELGAMVLALCRDPGGQVPDPDGTRHFVHVLTAWTA